MLPSGTTQSRGSGRIASIDFWRGVVLVMIFIDHVPGNPGANFTLRNFAFADAAEAFVFLSGLVLAYVSWPVISRGDFGATVRRCLTRAGQLYGVHLALTLGAVVLFGLGVMLGGPDYLISGANRQLAFDDPGLAIPGMLLLGYQINYFDILPVYVVLMLVAPVMLWLVYHRLPLALIFSFALYGVARYGYHPPSWPQPDNWFLNPFAWQLDFVIGMAVAGALRGRGIPYSRIAFIAACGIVLASLAYVRGWLPESVQAVQPYLDLHKNQLGLVRLVNFLALAYVVSQLRLANLLLKIPGAGAFAALGRQSLTIFAAGSILSAAATIFLSFPMMPRNLLVFDIIAMLTMGVGTALLFVLANYLEWRQAKLTGRIPVSARIPGHRG